MRSYPVGWLLVVELLVLACPASAGPPFWRLDTRSEQELRAELSRVPEAKPVAVELPNPRGSQMALLPTQSIKGLPFVRDGRAQLGKSDADALRTVSRLVRKHLEESSAGPGLDVAALRRRLTGDGALTAADAVPALVQMLQPEPAPVRLLLVDLLARIDGQRATEALAMRAMLDLSPAAREQACRHLRSRAPTAYRHLLLAGLRYPWAPVRAHAAEALVCLGDKDAVPELVALLEAPQANIKVVAKDKPPVLRELVRVNHLANCKMCHAAGTNSVRDNPVPGAVPKPSRPLPAPVRASDYYLKGDDFVRADVTFLRQDFSVTMPVARHGVWPAEQRFDFMVRLAPVPRDFGKFTERQFWENTKYAASKNKDLREFYVGQTRNALPEFTHTATLRALRELTGQDHEPTAWKRFVRARPVVATASRDWGQFLGGHDEEALKSVPTAKPRSKDHGN